MARGSRWVSDVRFGAFRGTNAGRACLNRSGIVPFFQAGGARIDPSVLASPQASLRTSQASRSKNSISKRAIRKCTFRKERYKLKNLRYDLVSKTPIRKRASAQRNKAARERRIHHPRVVARRQDKVEEIGRSSHDTGAA